MSEDATSSKHLQSKSSKPLHKKLKPLPSNFKVSKRPFHRPAIPSKFSSTDQQKVIYISTKTPFISAVKRVEKLLHLTERRLEQSATTLTKKNKNGKRQRNAAREEDEILEIAKTVEAEKKKRKAVGDAAGEEVVLKGTGKAIQKVLELALFFQQREEYHVRLKTGSVSAIDDITVDEDGEEGDSAVDAVGGAGREVDGAAMDVEDTSTTNVKDTATTKGKRKPVEDIEPPPETRIRYTSVLEVFVSLK